jgi:hypothetical protein
MSYTKQWLLGISEQPLLIDSINRLYITIYADGELEQEATRPSDDRQRKHA